MANLVYKNKKIYKKIHELSKEIQHNIELLEKEEKQKEDLQYSQCQNIILSINDKDSIVIKKESNSRSTAKTNKTGQKTDITKTITDTSSSVTKKLNHERPAAGRVGTKWDPTIIYWKNSLRGYYFL